MKRLWHLYGYRVEENVFYQLPGSFQSAEEARVSALEWEFIFNSPVHSPKILGEGIPDKVYIENPYGFKRRFVPDK